MPKLPGPRGGLIFGSLPQLTSDWLGYLSECERTYGRLVQFRLPWPLKSIVMVTDPDHIERIFISDAALFRKPVTQRVGKPVLGEGLFLTEGDTWKRLHRMSVPAFQPARIKTYADDMADCAEDMVGGWEHGAVRDVFHDTTHMTVRIVARTLFGTDAMAEAEQASHGLAQAFSAFDSFFNSRFPLPLSLPTPAGIRLYRAARVLDSVVYRFIDDRRRSGEHRSDLLSTLLRARDEEDGSQFTEKELRDVAINVFGAGFETTALTLAWTFLLLSRYPEVGQRIRQEVRSVVGEGRVRAEQVPQLKFTESVIKESMRLYPPGWLVAREALQDYELDGYPIKRGTQLFVLPYLMHHNREYFSDPERFIPDRWAGEATQRLPRFAYFPFGGGARICIGKHFAMMDSVISLATAARVADFELADRGSEPRVSFTLRPNRPIRLRISRVDRDQTATAAMATARHGPT
jgi:cytochrome P450